MKLNLIPLFTKSNVNILIYIPQGMNKVHLFSEKLLFYYVFLLWAAIVITVIAISTIISVLSALRLFMWTEINGSYLVVQGILRFQSLCLQ